MKKIKNKQSNNFKPNRTFSGNVAVFILLSTVGIFMLVPLVYVISNAFKPLDELFIFPPRFFVRNPSFDNFTDLFILMSSSWVPFTRYIFNTVFITAAGTTGHVLLASLAAFVLEKHRFPGRKIFFAIVITTLMFSPVVTAIPQYIIMVRLKLIDTLWAVILPAVAMPLGLFLMKQFIAGVNDSLIESAKIEGASQLKIFFRIIMPMVKPAWLTLIIFSMQALWNSTGGAFIFREEIKTLSFALNQIILGGIARAGIGSAVTFVMMSVPITAFILTQKNIIQTMSSSGIKE